MLYSTLSPSTTGSEKKRNLPTSNTDDIKIEEPLAPARPKPGQRFSGLPVSDSSPAESSSLQSRAQAFNAALLERMHQTPTEHKSLPKAPPDFSSVDQMNKEQKLEFLKRPDFDPKNLKNPFDYLNVQMYRWNQIAHNVEAGKYSTQDKEKIAAAAYDRMIAPYYARTQEDPMPKDMWMRHAYDIGKNFDIDRSYRSALYRGGSNGTMDLIRDALHGLSNLTNVFGALISPPHPITDESWDSQKHFSQENKNLGFWDQVRNNADTQRVLPTKQIRSALLKADDKVAFLQYLRPNKTVSEGAASIVIEAVPWVATTALMEGTNLLPEAGSLEAWIGSSRVGRITAGAIKAGVEGAAYGTLTRQETDKHKALSDAIAFAITSTMFGVLGAGGKKAVQFIGGKIVDPTLEASSELYSKWRAKGEFLEAGRREATPAEVEEESIQAKAEQIAKGGLAESRATENLAAEYLIEHEKAGTPKDKLKQSEAQMLEHGTPQQRMFLDDVTRLRGALQGKQLSLLNKDQKIDILAKIQALEAKAAGRLTDSIQTLKEAIRQKFEKEPIKGFNQSVLNFMIREVAAKQPGASREALAEAAKKRWAELTVDAGTFAERELTKDPVAEVKKVTSATRKATAKAGKPTSLKESTRRTVNKRGEPGVSYNLSPEWKSYMKSSLKNSNKEWTNSEIKNWIEDLSDDDFARDLEQYFLPKVLRENEIHFERGSVGAGGSDWSNLYAFAYNYRDKMPSQYTERLEEEFLNSPKYNKFWSGAAKNEREQIAQKLATAMWNHVDNFLGSGRFPQERNIYRSTQGALDQPTKWQAQLFEEREAQELGIIKELFSEGSDEAKAALNALNVLFNSRREAFKEGEQSKMKFASQMIARKLTEGGEYVDWGLDDFGSSETSIPKSESAPKVQSKPRENTFLADIEKMQTGRGNYVRIDQLREKYSNLSKEEFDREIIKLADAGKLILGAYDGPKNIPPEQEKWYVKDSRGERFIGVAIPRS